MTRYGYNVVMKQARIAELKARLSEYLRTVRSGETVTVLDRETPVARIVPIRQRGLRVRKPAPGAPGLSRLSFPPPLKLKIDVLKLLLEERQGQR